MTRAPEGDALSLIAGARDLLRLEGRGSVGLWSRAAVVVGRQGLETALDELWALRCPGLELTNVRCQLVCLPFFIEDPSLARQIAEVWMNLSEAVHYAGELPPLPVEVEAWLEQSWAAVNRVEEYKAR